MRPTLSALTKQPLPSDRGIDGRDMSDVLLDTDGGKSKHDILWIWSGVTTFPSAHHCPIASVPPLSGPNVAGRRGPAAARLGRFKAHCATGGGCVANVGGCTDSPDFRGIVNYPAEQPLLFDVDVDPSEANPLDYSSGTCTNLCHSRCSGFGCIHETNPGGVGPQPVVDACRCADDLGGM